MENLSFDRVRYIAACNSRRGPRGASRRLMASLGIAAAIAAGVHARRVSADTYYWDVNGTTSGFGVAVTGTWGTTGNVFWSTDSTGVAAPTVTSPTTADDLNIGTSTLGFPAGTITVSNVQSGNSLTFGAGNTGAITLSGGARINLGAAATVTVNNAAGATISTPFGGAATSFTKAGTGTLFIRNNSSTTSQTFTGSITVSTGMLSLGNFGTNDGSLPTGSAIGVTTGATLQFAGDAGTYTQGVQFSTAAITGAGKLQKVAGSTLVLNAANTISGGISIQQGTVTVLNDGGVTSSGTLGSSTAPLTLTGTRSGGPFSTTLNLASGVDTAVGNLTGSVSTGNTAVINTQTARSLLITQSGTTTYSAVIAGPGGVTLGSASTGVLTLSGSNTFAGGLNIKAGQVTASSNPMALGGTTGAVFLGDSSGSAPATLNFNFVSGGFANPITIQSGSSGKATIACTGFTTLSGAVTLNKPVSLFANGGILSFSGPITGSSNITSDATGTNYVTIGASNGSNPNWTGNLLVNTGTFKPGSSNATSVNNVVIVNPAATLDLQGTGMKIKGLIDGAGGGGTVFTSSATTAFLTVGGTSGTYTYSGAIGGSNPDKFAFVKSGLSTQILTGVNTYNAGCFLQNGILTVGPGGQLCAPTSLLSVSNNNTGPATAAVLNLATDSDTTVGSLGGTITNASSGVNTATINIAASRKLTVNQTSSFSYDGDIAGPGSFVMGSSSTSTLTFNGKYTYTGNTTVNGGTLIVNSPLRPVTGSLVVTGPGAVTLAAPATSVSATGYTVVGEFASISANSSTASGSVSLPVVDRSQNKASVLVTSSLSINGGTVDLGSSDLIIKGAASQISTIQSWVAGGSLKASAGSFGSAPFTTLATFVNDAGNGSTPYFTSYDGVSNAGTGSLSVSDVIVKYTYVGDTNLDGVLDGRDFKKIIEGYSTGQSGWAWGDVDNSGGTVSLDDVLAFNAAYNYYSSNPQIYLGGGAGTGGSGGVVPEPSAIGLLLMASPLAGRRRR